MELYFIRHGQTNSNAQAVNQAALGNDEPLNELGIQQANELAEQLKNKKIDTIISSPFRRAYQTAEIVNKYHDLSIDIDDAWREIQTNGYVDIRTWNDLFNFDKLSSINNKESLTDFFRRIYGALDALVAKNKGKVVAIVSHGGVQHACYTYANKLSLAGDIRISPMRNCEYRIYMLDK